MSKQKLESTVSIELVGKCSHWEHFGYTKLESTVSIKLVGLLSDVETVTAILTKQLRVIDQSIDVEQGRGFIRARKLRLISADIAQWLRRLLNCTTCRLQKKCTKNVQIKSTFSRCFER